MNGEDGPKVDIQGEKQGGEDNSFTHFPLNTLSDPLYEKAVDHNLGCDLKKIEKTKGCGLRDIF